VPELWTLGGIAHFMSKKTMNPQRWRFLAIVAFIYLSVFGVGYFSLPDDKRHGLIVLGLGLLPLGLIGLGVILFLWRRYPVEDKTDEDA
jgi:hypothetical protein